MSRIVVSSLALVACGAVALVYGIPHVAREPVETKTATAMLVVAPPASESRSESSASLSSVQAQASAVATTLAPSPPSGTAGEVPRFDVARIEPTGEAVIAGQAVPGATVELLRNGEPHDRAVADQSGQFVMVPSKLPPGNYELTLQSRQPDGKQAVSEQSVAVAIESNPQEKPVVALLTPDKPTVVLSQPTALESMDGKITVETVETAAGGKLFVTGHSPPGAAVRLYLNDSFLASSTAATDGHFAFIIDGGVKPGAYRVRLDQVASNSGAVRSRAEVPFNVPDIAGVTSSVPASSPKRPGITLSQRPDVAAATTTAPPDKSSPSTVVVSEIVTTTVSRGDSLWRISRVTYGAGQRYAVIYKANRDQIRNPDLIYPGQIFVLPAEPH